MSVNVRRGARKGPMERRRACICLPRHDGYVRLEEKPGEAPVFAFTAIHPSVARDIAATALCDSLNNGTATLCGRSPSGTPSLRHSHPIVISIQRDPVYTWYQEEAQWLFVEYGAHLGSQLGYSRDY
jgi:hypothetical protein